MSVIQDQVHGVNASSGVRKLGLAEGETQGLIQTINPETFFFEQIENIVDLQFIRDSGLKCVVDPMHGAGGGFFPKLVGNGKTTIHEIRGEQNPAFPGMHNPEPVAHNLEQLRQTIVEGKADVGLAMDGDADRVGLVDENGRFITTLQVYALLAYYLLEIRGLRGPLIKSITVGSMPEKLGALYGVPVRETAVGFKYIAPAMAEGEALLGGEESGGYAFRGHLPERDGILSGLIILDLVARTGKKVSELVEQLFSLIGEHHFDRLDVPFPESLRPQVEKRLAESVPHDLNGSQVIQKDQLDGVRFRCQGDSWVIIRFSGTEPLLRIMIEGPDIRVVHELATAIGKSANRFLT